MKNPQVPGNYHRMDPATIIGTTSAVLSFVQFAGKIIKTGAELHSKKTNATEINESFEESVTDFKERVAVLKTETSHASISHDNNSLRTDDVWNDLLRCSNTCEKLGRRILGLLAKCKAKTKPPRVGIRERLNIKLSATHKADGSPRAELSLTEVMRASVVTVWTSDETESLRGQWSQCIAAFNAACARYRLLNFPEILKLAINSLTYNLGSSRPSASIAWSRYLSIIQAILEPSSHLFKNSSINRRI